VPQARETPKIRLGSTRRRDGAPGRVGSADVDADTPLAERARTALHAAGARPRRTALTGPDAMSPSEARVAHLAAAGQSNREIAPSLFITVKTVENHLGDVYRKLGVGNRVGLARQLPRNWLSSIFWPGN
jgi:DNA-binding CsgD family transcriptional regulator